MKRSYRTQESLLDRLDLWFGPDAWIWRVLSERIIPLLAKMSMAMGSIMFIAALLHQDGQFAALLAALTFLTWKLRQDARQSC